MRFNNFSVKNIIIAEIRIVAITAMINLILKLYCFKYLSTSKNNPNLVKINRQT